MKMLGVKVVEDEEEEEEAAAMVEEDGAAGGGGGKEEKMEATGLADLVELRLFEIISEGKVYLYDISVNFSACLSIDFSLTSFIPPSRSLWLLRSIFGPYSFFIYRDVECVRQCETWLFLQWGGKAL